MTQQTKETPTLLGFMPGALDGREKFNPAEVRLQRQQVWPKAGTVAAGQSSSMGPDQPVYADQE